MDKFPNNQKTVVVTGGSSGIGLQTAEQFLSKGCKVFSLSRSCPQNPDIIHIPCDVTDESNVESALARVAAEGNGIDIVVLCAGFGISGAAEETPESTMQSQLKVNYFGGVNASRLALPFLRASKGSMVFVSSLAAVMPIPFQSHYSASKAALLAYSRAISSEVKPFGVRVSAILPGDIKTAFTEKRVKAPQSEIYKKSGERAVKIMEHDEQNGMTPLFIAKKIVNIALKKSPKPFYTAGFKYTFLYGLTKILPARFTDFVIRKMYC